MDSSAKQKLKVTVNGKPFLVEVDDLSASPLTVKVNGKSYLVDIETGPVEQASVSTPAQALDMTSPPMPVPTKIPPLTSPAGANTLAVQAPMPGYIIDIVVKPGDAVKAGQMLCSLEAMKMKNAIQSPRSGVIASVEVALEQSVTYGDVLVTFKE